MSLMQKNEAGIRTDEEAQLFRKALASLAEWYSHPNAILFKVTCLPEGYPQGFQFPPGNPPNQAGYYERGWCFYESSVANLCKDFRLVLDLGHLGPSDVEFHAIRVACALQAGRAVPLPPAEFDVKLD
eukprot:2099489-Prymnesium_polylepis.2